MCEYCEGERPLAMDAYSPNKRVNCFVIIDGCLRTANAPAYQLLPHVRARPERRKGMKTRSLGFTDGMLYGMGRTAADGPKVLDWERAAEMCAASDAPVYAGLAEDWSCTSGMIWDGRKQVRDYVYVWSSWATPVLVVGDDTDDGIECFKAATPEDPSEYPEWWGDGGDHA